MNDIRFASVPGTTIFRGRSEGSQVVRELYSRGFSDAELVDVATSLRRRLDGPGFDINALPVGFIAVDEGEMLADENPAATARSSSRFDPGRRSSSRWSASRR